MTSLPDARAFLLRLAWHRPCFLRSQEGRLMELVSVRHIDFPLVESRCVVCGAQVAGAYLCKGCEQRGLNSRQFAELFWDEA